MDEGHQTKLSGLRGGLIRAATHPRVRRWLGGALLTLGAAVALFLGGTETGRYLVRAAWEETKILWNRRPITDLVADPDEPRATRDKLQLVLDARAYAKEYLHLDVGNSFASYSPLEHDTLVLVLSAAYRDRLERYRWWFPVVGFVPYKGWFDFSQARGAERDFARRGYDTYLRPASAFSTLGWFNDPLVSTTLKSDTLSLANTVVHELLHNSFYASGQADFNESFANFVGARGSAEFFRARGHADAAEEADARWSDEKVLARFWTSLHDDIDSAFKAHPGPDARQLRLALRDSIYRAARHDLVFRIGPQLRTIAPRYVERVRLDNAALLARRIYLTDLDVFDAVWVREGMDTRHAIDRIIALARSGKRDPYGALRRWLANPAAGESAGR